MRAKLLVAVPLAGALLAGCGAGATKTAVGVSSGAPTDAGSPTTPVTETVTTTPAAGTSTSAPTTGAPVTTSAAPVRTSAAPVSSTSALPPPSTPPQCQSDQLAPGLGTGPGQGAAGSTYVPLQVTNAHGSRTCTLQGFPGVSYLASMSGPQVGVPADRDTARASETITLKPGQVAYSLLRVVSYQNYPPSTCRAEPVSGIRVYPPGETHPLYVAVPAGSKSCSNSAVHLLTISPFRAGSGPS